MNIKKTKQNKKMVKLKKVEICIFFLILFPISIYAAIEVETTTPLEGDEIWVNCETNVQSKAVKAKIDGVDCQQDVDFNIVDWLKGWFTGQGYNPKVRYLCTVPPGGQGNIECYIDESISYVKPGQSGSTSTSITPQAVATCNPGQYKVGNTCFNCGGVRLCSGGPIVYCGVSDGICPSTYGANCANHADCTDPNC